MGPMAALTVLVQAKGISELNRQLSGVDADLRKTAANASKAADGLEDTGKRGSKAMGVLKTAAAGVALVGGTVLLAGKKFLSLASDAEETASKFRTVFGKETPRAIRQLDAFSKATGTSKYALREQAAGLQALIRPMGLSEKASSGLSIGMTKLATDLASFNNTSVEEAITALKSGLVGEAEPMRRFGVQLSAARVEAFAYANGIAKQGAELTAAQKAQASYGIIMQDTKLAQGDATKTAGSFANQVKRAKAMVTDMATELGMKLKPAALAVVQGFTSFVNGAREGTGVGGAFIDVLKGIGAAVGAVVGAISKTVKWFKDNETVTVALGAAVGILAAAYVTSLIPGIVAATGVLYSQVAAWIALKAAMLTNPFVLIVAGLAALAAGLVVAYRESETFRKIVDGVLEWLKDAATAVFGFLKTFIPGAWETIRAATSTAWNAIRTIITAVFDALHTVITTWVGVHVTVITTAWNTIKTVTTTTWNAIKTVLTGVWSAITAAAHLAWDATSLAILTPIRAARDGLALIWTTIKTVASTAWEGLKIAADTAWDGIRAAILTPIRAARDLVSGVWHSMGVRAAEAWSNLKDGVSNFAGDVKDGVERAFRGAANTAIDFINAIIKAINLIPGVPNIDLIKKLAEGGVHGGSHIPPNKLARGGAFGMTGGLVNRPITLMGEEAPRHPEFVIPTNPAYRSRAQGLLAQAAGAIGLAKGGTFSSTSYGPPWNAMNGSGVTATGVNLRNAPAVYGIAVDPSVIQLGERVKINPNPFGYDGQFKAFDTGGAIKGNRIDFYDWRGRAAQMEWGRRNVHVSGINQGGLGGMLNSATGAVGGVVGAVSGVMGDLLSKGAGFILDKLPGVGDLPDWLKGTGRYVLDKATGWIKDKVGGLVASIGGGGGGGGDVNGLQPAVTAALAFARANGWAGQVNSGFRSRAEQQRLYDLYLSGRGNLAAPPGNSMHERGLAVDVSQAEQFAAAMRKMGGGALMRKVPGEPWHFSTTGYRKGGMYGAPFVGSYATGGIVPRDGMAYVHKGETINPAGRGGGGDVHVHGDVIVQETSDIDRLAGKWAWQLQSMGALSL